MSVFYMRYEPTNDPEILRLIAECPQLASANRKRDVQAYHDAECTVTACRWPWWRQRKPSRAWKRICLNYAVTPIVWLRDLESAA